MNFLAHLYLSGNNEDILFGNFIADAVKGKVIDNYNSTIDINAPLSLKKGNDVEMETLSEELNKGEISGIILYGVNPGYDYKNGNEFLAGLKKADLSVSIPNLKDETAEQCNYLCPDHYVLESWNDNEIKPGYYSLTQPAIRPIFKMDISKIISHES